MHNDTLIFENKGEEKKKKKDPAVFNSWLAKETIKAYPALTQDGWEGQGTKTNDSNQPSKHLHERAQHSHWKSLANKEQVPLGSISGYRKKSQ